ncbi:hypothetical protein KAU33_16700 [Candidatus Dependentiae bacterium]|nr:hypothetical protein [Candidatus Dependentiae bacterium]
MSSGGLRFFREKDDRFVFRKIYGWGYKLGLFLFIGLGIGFIFSLVKSYQTSDLIILDDYFIFGVIYLIGLGLYLLFVFKKVEIVKDQYIKLGYFKKINISDINVVFMKFQKDDAPFKVNYRVSGLTTGFSVYIRVKQNKKYTVFRSGSNSKSKQFQTELRRLLKKHTTKHSPKKSKGNEIYTRGFEKWTKEEDELLKQEFKKGKSIKELAKQFHRNPRAISSRLYKLGIWY